MSTLRPWTAGRNAASLRGTYPDIYGGRGRDRDLVDRRHRSDATGLLIAVRVLRRPDGPVVRLSVPSTGYTTDITAERTPRVLDMLQRHRVHRHHRFIIVSRRLRRNARIRSVYVDLEPAAVRVR